MERHDCLLELLDLDIYDEKDRKKLDESAIIREAQRNPNSVKQQYKFSYNPRQCLPLHQAIMLRASVNIIDALYFSAEKTCKYYTLHLAIMYNAPVDVISFLLEKQPEAIRDMSCVERETLLFYSIRYGASIEVVSLLLDQWADAVRVKNQYGLTALHLACVHASIDVVSLILDLWPDALKEKTVGGYTPLHLACDEEAPLDVISLLVNRWPGSLRVKTHSGNVPLHIACGYENPFDVVLLLLDKYPQASVERNDAGATPACQALRCLAPESTQKLLYYAYVLFEDGADDPSPNDIMSFFIDIHWWNGVSLVFDHHPRVAHNIDLRTNLMADFLSMIGQRCHLKTMWETIRNKQDLIADL